MLETSSNLIKRAFSPSIYLPLAIHVYLFGIFIGKQAVNRKNVGNPLSSSQIPSISHHFL